MERASNCGPAFTLVLLGPSCNTGIWNTAVYTDVGAYTFDLDLYMALCFGIVFLSMSPDANIVPLLCTVCVST